MACARRVRSRTVCSLEAAQRNPDLKAGRSQSTRQNRECHRRERKLRNVSAMVKDTDRLKRTFCHLENKLREAPALLFSGYFAQRRGVENRFFVATVLRMTYESKSRSVVTGRVPSRKFRLNARQGFAIRPFGSPKTVLAQLSFGGGTRHADHRCRCSRR
jgi:hypothetical protein